MPAEGFFDFSIKQLTDSSDPDNTNKSKLNKPNSNNTSRKRYQKTKYMLVRDN
jgi:hypothetical protein